MSRAKGILASIFAAAAAILILGCASSANDQAPKFSASQQAHPANWLHDHWAEFIKNPDQCRTCHGSTTDPDKAGGIAKVSCFTCHENGPSHQTGWADASKHGRMGAQLAASDTSGFAYCAKCHGSSYDNPVGQTPSCKACHTKAPHPNKPWNGATASLPNHTFTHISNAPECFKCHANGANSTKKPDSPAPAGTAPGCFNNTMCHGTHI